MQLNPENRNKNISEATEKWTRKETENQDLVSFNSTHSVCPSFVPILSLTDLSEQLCPKVDQISDTGKVKHILSAIGVPFPSKEKPCSEHPNINKLSN